MGVIYDKPPGFSWAVAFSLVAIIGSGTAVFWALVHRWTMDRQRASLSDWAKEKHYVSQRIPCAVPAPLDEATHPLRTIICLQGEQFSIMQLEGEDASPPPRWNALVADLATSWKPTALRPAHAERSLLDLVSLSSYPLMGETDRFVIYGTDTASARKLSKSHARGLLPPDIGLLLHGEHLVLDFSTRPFDPIEFERMIALAEQLVAQLPM